MDRDEGVVDWALLLLPLGSKGETNARLCHQANFPCHAQLCFTRGARWDLNCLRRDWRVVWPSRATRTSPAINLAGAITISSSTWTYVAAVRVSSAMYMYLNGVRIGTTSSTRNIANTNGVIGRVYWGYDGNYLTGYIDEVRFSKSARYGVANFTLPSAPFTDA